MWAGLCGTMNDDCSDEFILRDGSLSSAANAVNCAASGYNTRPNDFGNSWRSVKPLTGL